MIADNTYRVGPLQRLTEMGLVWTLAHHERMAVGDGYIVLRPLHLSVLRGEVAIEHNGRHVFVSNGVRSVSQDRPGIREAG